MFMGRIASPGKLPVIGAYCISNTGSILVHAIDHAEDKVLASINGNNPIWCGKTEKMNDEGETEPGFVFGSFFVPFSMVMRTEI